MQDLDFDGLLLSTLVPSLDDCKILSAEIVRRDRQRKWKEKKVADRNCMGMLTIHFLFCEVPICFPN